MRRLNVHELVGCYCALPLALSFLKEARASSQHLREHVSDGSHYRLELRWCEIAQTQVLPMIAEAVR